MATTTVDSSQESKKRPVQVAQSKKSKMSSQKAPRAQRERLSVRMTSETRERVKYWAERGGQSANDWILEAIEERIARLNGDYDLPTLEQARLNQLIDQQKSTELVIMNLERVVIAMSESITGLARGDNYLLGEEDGELD